ncbi:MAG: pyrroline-5-carboxylate reductase [Syntrophaceae bacterium]|nr:pyrroline-5-carboxylate reductase [Syntrophaceae bacterium]
MDKKTRIGFIGGGKMGGAIVGGLLSRGVADAGRIWVSDTAKDRLQKLKDLHGIHTTTDNRTAVKNADILILAVKPQVMGSVLKGLSGAVGPSKLVISIAAGIPIAFLEEHLGKGVRVIRTMPNTPALIGEGATALARGSHASEQDLEAARQIFNAVGQTVLVPEEQLDAVTGLSGSGPAYGFIILEALSDGGVRMGLPRDTALVLAAQTLLGAARLVLAGDKHPGQLKDMVTSPGGTTIAGIQALEEGGLRAALIRAVEAATLRSQELGKAK